MKDIGYPPILCKATREEKRHGPFGKSLTRGEKEDEEAVRKSSRDPRSNVIDPAFVCITCLLLTAEISSLSPLIVSPRMSVQTASGPRERGTLFLDRAQQGWIHGERETPRERERGALGPYRVSFIKPGSVNPGSIDTMMVQRRHDAPPSRC